METAKKEPEATVILFPYSPQQFLEQIRKILQEEKYPKEKVDLSPPDGLTNKPLYTISEIRKLFTISKPTVYQWIRAGKLHPVKIRARVYFKGSEVGALIG